MLANPTLVIKPAPDDARACVWRFAIHEHKELAEVPYAFDIVLEITVQAAALVEQLVLKELRLLLPIRWSRVPRLNLQIEHQLNRSATFAVDVVLVAMDAEISISHR